MKTFVLMMVSLLFAISSEAQNKSFYDFTVKTIDGKDFPLSSLKGKKVLVVNVASKCGLTPQYAQLEKLYEKYKEKDFVVIGFPANNFMGQEPGSNEEIAKFCSLNYDVTFPMMAKISQHEPLRHHRRRRLRGGRHQRIGVRVRCHADRRERRRRS